MGARVLTDPSAPSLTEVKGAARRAGCRGGLHAWVAGDRLRGWTRRRKRAVPTRTVWVLHDYGSLPRRDLDRSGRRRESCEKPLETLDLLVQTPTNWCTLGTCSRGSPVRLRTWWFPPSRTRDRKSTRLQSSH